MQKFTIFQQQPQLSQKLLLKLEKEACCFRRAELASLVIIRVLYISKASSLTTLAKHRFLFLAIFFSQASISQHYCTYTFFSKERSDMHFSFSLLLQIVHLYQYKSVILAATLAKKNLFSYTIRSNACFQSYFGGTVIRNDTYTLHSISDYSKCRFLICNIHEARKLQISPNVQSSDC